MVLACDGDEVPRRSVVQDLRGPLYPRAADGLYFEMHFLYYNFKCAALSDPQHRLKSGKSRDHSLSRAGPLQHLHFFVVTSVLFLCEGACTCSALPALRRHLADVFTSAQVMRPHPASLGEQQACAATLLTQRACAVDWLAGHAQRHCQRGAPACKDRDPKLRL